MPSFLAALPVRGKIEIIVDKVRYQSFVQDILSDDEFLVIYPMDRRGVPLELAYDRMIEVVYLWPDRGRYVYRCQVVARAREKSVVLLRLRALAEPKRTQERDSYRLATSIPVQIVTPVENDGEEPEVYDMQTVNFSESGALVEFPRMARIGKIFCLRYTLPESDGDESEVSVQAEVRRMLPPEDARRTWRLGLRYIDCSEEARQRIAKFILSRQIDRRLKEI